MEEYWPWVGEICKCLGANARGFPGVNPPGWPLIGALVLRGREPRVKSPPNPGSAPVLYSEGMKKVHFPITGEPKSSENEVKTLGSPRVSSNGVGWAGGGGLNVKVH